MKLTKVEMKLLEAVKNSWENYPGDDDLSVRCRLAHIAGYMSESSKTVSTLLFSILHLDPYYPLEDLK